MTRVLDIQDVSKRYRRFASEWLRVLGWFIPGIRPLEEHTVLEGISFSLGAGEAIGLVGQNGAGKSTLLKLITGTTTPSSGLIHSNGRVNALLELGMGFHPELTGRQNVIHSAQLMGHDLRTIEEALSGIESFAEIGEYFDQPVRTYSSGMQVRVAFAVATFDRPDLLIVDEALAVGDAYFQHKSFRRIRELKDAGTSLLIVSHDRSSIQTLCDRAILLDKGHILRDGPPEVVMDHYNALIAEREGSTFSASSTGDGRFETRSGTLEAIASEVTLLNDQGQPSDTVSVGEEVCLQILVKVQTPLERLILGYAIKDRLGLVVYGTNTEHKEFPLVDLKPGEAYLFSVQFRANLGPGSYSVQTALCNSENHVTGSYEWRDMALVFNVVNLDKAPFAGCAWIDPLIQIEKEIL